MGSSASKTARSYPARPSSAVFPNGSKAARPQTQPESLKSRPAESHRTEAIEKDGADPQFLSNLSRLGQVQVDHHMQPIRPAADNTRLFQSRSTESEPSSPQERKKNHLYAFMLSDLLDKRKSIETEKDLERLATDFGMEPDRLKRLARFVNSPSINSSSIRAASGKSEEEGFVATAIWVESKGSG